MPRQADLTALVNLIEQAYLMTSGYSMPQGGQESAREPQSGLGAGEAATAGKQNAG
jgi:hypothetical protein